MGDAMTAADRPEPFAFLRFLVRSAILGAAVPVTQGEFWNVKVIQIASALVLCLVLYGLERLVRNAFQRPLEVRPIRLAAYRGALLYCLLTFSFSGDWLGVLAGALGAAIGGALFAMLLFWLERGIIKVVYRTPTTNGPLEGGPK